MSSRRIWIAVTVVAVLGAALAHGQETVVRCAGCKTEHFLIEHLKTPFAAATGLKLLPGATGNKKAVELLAAGELDFAFTCKPHGKLVKKFGLDPAATAHWATVAIARDPIVVVANPDAGVSDLTVDQLRALFTGQVTNWRELGGADRPVRTAYLDGTVESGVVTVFREVCTGLETELAADAKRLASPGQLGNYVKSTPGGVTFMALNSYEPQYGRALAVGGVTPERAAIQNGDYPLTVVYHVVYDQAQGDAARAFLAYVGGAQGRALVDEIMVAVTDAANVMP